MTAAGVIERGRVYIRGGVIADVGKWGGSRRKCAGQVGAALVALVFLDPAPAEPPRIAPAAQHLTLGDPRATAHLHDAAWAGFLRVAAPSNLLF